MHFDTDFVMTIAGESRRGANSLSVINPATEQVIAAAPVASDADLDDAVISATRAFELWRDTSLEHRRRLLLQVADLLEAHSDALALQLTREQGRPIRAALAEITRAASFIRHYATIDIPTYVFEDSERRRIQTDHVPLGVVAAIAPWNFPITLAVWKLAPALLAGNCVVLKPSPLTPLTTLKIGELIAPLFPPGVFNVISGGDDLGPKMTAHPGFAKIAFTGSTATGKKVMQAAAATLKRVTLELGGNDPAIVLADVDVQKVARSIFWGAFYNSAQMCIASKRLYLHANIYDAMLDALVAIAKRVTIGNGIDPKTGLGPLQNRAQLRRVRELMDEAEADGLRLIVVGDVPSKGYFFPIVFVDNPPDESRVVREEAFGPILPILKFTDIDEVVRRANATDFGLSASVWSTDIDQALAVARKLEAGTVLINESLYTSPAPPFGGHKQSGIGVENGLKGLLEYTQCKTYYVSAIQ